MIAGKGRVGVWVVTALYRNGEKEEEDEVEAGLSPSR